MIGPLRLRPLCAFLHAAVALIVIAAFPGTAHAQWQTLKFEVFEGQPSEGPGWQVVESMRTSRSTVPQSVREELETYMSEAAKIYQDLGFADPVAAGALESVENAAGEQVIRLYLQTPQETPGLASIAGAYVSRKPTDLIFRSSLNLNIARIYVNGSIPDNAYQTLAHELFHAIQWASPYSRGGQNGYGRWISEGTADAMGYYVSRELRQLTFSRDNANNPQFLKIYGGRSYDIPLNDTSSATGSEAYMTSSFWRYLAELTYASRHGKPHPGAQPAKEDYSYLADFLNTPNTEADTRAGQIRWLNKAMRAHPQIHSELASVYAHFVASFADTINTRMQAVTIAPHDRNLEIRWLNKLFGACPYAGLVERYPQTTHTIQIDANAAACFYIAPSAEQTAQTVKIEITGQDPGLLAQLRIGMQDGSFLGPPLLAPSKTSSDTVASWKFPVIRRGGVRMTFIVSNMADNPAQSRSQEVTLRMTMDNYGFQLDSGEQGPLPPPPIYGPEDPRTASSTAPTPTPAPTPKPTRREIVQRDREARASREPMIEDLSPVAKLEPHTDNDAGCTPTRRQLNLCGDQLHITLEVSLASLQQNILAADSATDMIGAVFGVGGKTVPGTDARIAISAERLIENIDGHKIVIRVPMIDYGFTGTFDHAAIEVAKAGDSYHPYRAVGPTVKENLFAVHHRPPNGHVTIVEYSPTVLHGIFSADLVDEANPGSEAAPIVANRIEGEFTISSPWRWDPDYRLDADAIRDALADNMLQQSPFGANPMREMVRTSGVAPQSLCDAGLGDDQLAAIGFPGGCKPASSSSGAVSNQCSCDCYRREAEEPNSACEPVCRADWAACPTPDASPSALTGGPGDAAEIDAQAARLEKLMIEQNVSDFVRARFLEGFRQAPPDVRAEMLKRYGD